LKVTRSEVIAWHYQFLALNADAVINESINDALAEAEAAGVRGKEVTPFILAAVSKITAGQSLQTSESDSL
jgi:pseudouridine-5'-phosphate glycosidase